ncbi:c-type cytochrome [Deinococcus sp. YIM 134068]|uniref:c-type cytochrome n=1 Tax=Deinococcus lichenicola TaxID=3118910 RepID=UPI002F934B42
MKNTFAVTMTLLLALTLGGSYAGYRIATTPHHEEGIGAGGEEVEGGDPTTAKVPSEEAPSAREAATGEAGAGGALGDVMQDQAGGTQSGENGAVIVPGGESNTGTQTGEAQEGDAADGGAGEADEASTGQSDGTTGPGVESSRESTPVGGTNAADGAPAGDTRGTPSPTESESEENTQLGQTGASNIEKTMAGDPATGDAKAAEVANAIGGDTAAGQAKFVSSCGGCHGQNGEGGIGTNLIAEEGPRGWKLEEFEVALREGHSPSRDLGAVMPRFTEEQLSDEDVLNIYTFLRAVN